MTPLDLSAIRRIAEAGLPVMPATVLALCERVETMEYITEHTRRAVAILSEQPYTMAGQTLPEAVQALCDRVKAAEKNAASFQRLATQHQAMTLQLAQEWQGVIVALLADALLNAVSISADAIIELKNTNMHPYFAGKLALLRYLRELTDADVARFQNDTPAALISVLSAARAWAMAIERCDGIADAEQALLGAIRACEA